MTRRTPRARPPLTPARRRALLALLGVLALAAFAAALGAGASAVGWSDLAAALEPGSLERAVLFEVRLPRALAAAALGAALALSGTAFQALLRNPLADPFVLGVSGGASLGGVLALLAGGGRLALVAGAFAGALAALAAIERLATERGRLSVFSVLLAGAVFNAFAGAALFFLQSVASLEELHAIVFHLMGRIAPLAPWELALLAAAVLGCGALLTRRGRELNALAFGEEGALQLGVEVERLKRATLVAGSLLAALAVAFAGMIGFVGLVVPHLLRLTAGPDHRQLVPASLLAGASFLLLADLAARTALAPRELPVGVLTALVGGPFFLFVLRRHGGGHG